MDRLIGENIGRTVACKEMLYFLLISIPALYFLQRRNGCIFKCCISYSGRFKI